MKKIALLCMTAFGLAACGSGGGDDFSGTDVAGCPANRSCEESVRGDVLIELMGPQVSNLGYRCNGTSVVFKTAATEQISVDSDGSEITIPPYNALCPNTATSIEFFVGNALFEGNHVIVGKMLLPRESLSQRYQITFADLVGSPARLKVTRPGVRNRAALIQGLDANTNTKTIEIPEAAHEVVDDRFNLVPENSLGTGVYDEFRNLWQAYFDEVNQRTPVAGMNPDPSLVTARVTVGNNRSRAGLYSFQTCELFPCEDDGPNNEEHFVSTNLPQRDANASPRGQFPLVLPNGTLLGFGLAIRNSNTETLNDRIAFSQSARFDDELRLQDASIEGVFDNNDVTAANITGRLFEFFLYSGETGEIVEGGGTSDQSDFSLDFPSLDRALAEDEKGKLNGPVLGDDVVDFPIRARKTSFNQAAPNQAVINELEGTYHVRLFRACLNQDNPDDPASGCRDIPNVDKEVEESGQTVVNANYPAQIGDSIITKEKARADARTNASSPAFFCVEIRAQEGSDTNGLVYVGEDDACPSASANEYAIGFVSRTFDSPRSANLVMNITPGAPQQEAVPNFGVSIQGRVDLTQDCRPLLRLSETNFNDGVRARWLDDYLPVRRAQEFQTASEDGTLTADEEEFVSAISFGAVEFGTPTCVPAP